MEGPRQIQIVLTVTLLLLLTAGAQKSLAYGPKSQTLVLVSVPDLKIEFEVFGCNPASLYEETMHRLGCHVDSGWKGLRSWNVGYYDELRTKLADLQATQITFASTWTVWNFTTVLPLFVSGLVVPDVPPPFAMIAGVGGCGGVDIAPTSGDPIREDLS